MERKDLNLWNPTIEELNNLLIDEETEDNEEGDELKRSNEVDALAKGVVDQLPDDILERLINYEFTNSINRTGLYLEDYHPEKYKDLYYVTWPEFEKYFMDELCFEIVDFDNYYNKYALENYKDEEGNIGPDMELFWYFFILHFTLRFRKIRWVIARDPIKEDSDDFLTIEFA